MDVPPHEAMRYALLQGLAQLEKSEENIKASQARQGVA
jgi:hypothetical protein